MFGVLLARDGLLLHARRNQALDRRPVPQLTGAVVPPAVDARARTGREGARVVRTCGHTGEAEVPKDGLRRQSDDGRVIADLAIAVWAPAVPDPPGRDAARMERAAADEAELETPLHEGGYGPGVCCIVAEPTTVGTPTIRGAGRRHRARVGVPCVECGEGDTGGSASLDRRRRVRARVVTELAGTTPSPAIHRSAGLASAPRCGPPALAGWNATRGAWASVGTLRMAWLLWPRWPRPWNPQQ